MLENYPLVLNPNNAPFQFVSGGSYVKATHGRIIDTGYQFELWVTHDGKGETHLASRKLPLFSEYLL